MRILGIDPGSIRTGFGVIEQQRAQARYVACGVIGAKGTVPERLLAIFAGIDEVIETYQPVAVAIERVFLARNPDSALKLGQARGAALVAAARHGVAVFEYTALQIKKTCVGVGHADKTQVQHMIRVLLGLSVAPSSDAADALACAICHLHHQAGAASAGLRP
ncbi:MAG: crossover junction endodeoxyribonuclease RuvC [Gammaproteobacteria bacterium]|nr:crossover junction endodeoxyribonuclease RuvC [Gammaproteobacteria bacterium]